MEVEGASFPDIKKVYKGTEFKSLCISIGIDKSFNGLINRFLYKWELNIWHSWYFSSLGNDIFLIGDAGTTDYICRRK